MNETPEQIAHSIVEGWDISADADKSMREAIIKELLRARAQGMAEMVKEAGLCAKEWEQKNFNTCGEGPFELELAAVVSVVKQLKKKSAQAEQEGRDGE